ncbi:MAG: hypothetical protein AAF495_25915 [Pseudomonadota bacterium]
MKKSPKREAKLKSIQGSSERPAVEDDNISEFDEILKNPTIKLFCHTRWTVRAECLKSVIENFDELQELWDWSLKNCSNSDMKARIRGIKVYSKKFAYCFGIHLAHLILSHTDNLNQTLQGTQMTANDAHANAKKCIETLERIRDDKNVKDFDLFWEKVTKFATKHKIDAPVLPRKRNPPLKAMWGKAPAEHPKSPEDDYRQKYNDVIDNIKSCLQDRFDQPDFEMYACLEQLLLNAINEKPFQEEFDKVTQFYKGDFDNEILKVQLRTLPVVLEATETIANFYDIRKEMKKLKYSRKALISEVVKLVKLIIVMPATNAVSERSFSAMRRLFTYLRSNMGMSRLNNTMVLPVHKERLDKLSLIDVANDFVSGIDHRETVFGKFETTDLRSNTRKRAVKSVGTQVNL